MDLQLLVGWAMVYLFLAWRHNWGGWKYRKPLYAAAPLWLKWLCLRPDRDMLDLITAHLQLGFLGIGVLGAGLDVGAVGRETGRALFWTGIVSWGILTFNLDRIQKLMNRRYLKTRKQRLTEERSAKKARRAARDRKPMRNSGPRRE